jgi:large subunit ribosomal protein L32
MGSSAAPVREKLQSQASSTSSTENSFWTEEGFQYPIVGTPVTFNMAAAHVTTWTILSSFLPQFSTSTTSIASRTTTLRVRQLAHPLLPTLSLSPQAAIQLKIPTLLGDLWESVLRAVPKKKTSYMKKRSRFMAGKALKDVTALNRCSACGHVKKAHVLCPYCVKGRPEIIVY